VEWLPWVHKTRSRTFVESGSTASGAAPIALPDVPSEGELRLAPAADDSTLFKLVPLESQGAVAARLL
jgi:hypothetical protein